MYREYLKSGVLTEVSFDDNMTCAHCAHCIRKCVSQNNKKKLGGGGGQVSVTTFNPRTRSITANCSHFRPRTQNIMRFSEVTRLKSAAAIKVWRTDVIRFLRTQRLLHFIDGTSLKPEPDGSELISIAESDVIKSWEAKNQEARLLFFQTIGQVEIGYIHDLPTAEAQFNTTCHFYMSLLADLMVGIDW